MKSKKRYAERLIERVVESADEDTTTLQLSIQISKIEKQNLENLVEFLKRNNQKASVRSVCYEALKESGVFDKIEVDSISN